MVQTLKNINIKLNTNEQQKHTRKFWWIDDDNITKRLFIPCLDSVSTSKREDPLTVLESLVQKIISGNSFKQQSACPDQTVPIKSAQEQNTQDTERRILSHDLQVPLATIDVKALEFTIRKKLNKLDLPGRFARRKLSCCPERTSGND